MTVNAFAARPAGRSIGAAVVGLAVTLVIFVIVFVGFLIAPLIMLALAFIVYLVMRPRQARPGRGQDSDEVEPTGFGAGAR